VSINEKESRIDNHNNIQEEGLVLASNCFFCAFNQVALYCLLPTSILYVNKTKKMSEASEAGKKENGCLQKKKFFSRPTSQTRTRQVYFMQ